MVRNKLLLRKPNIHTLLSQLTMAEDDESSSELSNCSEPVQSPMVFIRDSSNTSDCFLFPPINHENLQISSRFDPEETDPPPPSPSSSPSSSSLSSSSSFSPSDVNWVDASPPPSSASPPPPAFDSKVHKPGGLNVWLAVGLHVLYSRVVRLVSSIQNYAACRVPIWSFPRWAVVVAVVVWLYRRVHRRKSHNQMMHQIIKEKDEKITQLLHRISQMNEVLLARHRVLISKLPD